MRRIRSLGLVCAVAVMALASCTHRARASLAHYEAGDYAGAARAAERGLAAHPGDDGLWQMRIRAALALGDRAGIAPAYAAHRAQRGADDRELLVELATATLAQGLASPSARLKLIAIEAVASAELHALAERVAERMGDDDDRVAAAAAIAVLRGFPQAPQVASDMLQSEDSEARRIAVDGIGKKVGRLALDDLRTAAADPDPRVRRAAIRWLGQLRDDQARALLERQLRHADDGVRAAAVTALARIGGSELAAIARRALADGSLAVRLAAIDLVVASRQPAILVALAADPDPVVALEAALAARRPELAARALERAATGEAWTTRAAAANLAVRAVGDAGATRLARRLIADREVAVRLAAARVLARTDRAAAVVVFTEALAGEQALSAAIDLARLDEPRGTVALDAALRDDRAPGERRIAAVVAHRTAHRVTPGLVAALADRDGVVRVEAAAALVAIAR